MHTMYKTLLLGTALLAAACRPVSLQSDGPLYTVSVNATSFSTKATADTRSERTVQRLDLFAFNADGQLENSCHDTNVNDSGNLSATVTVSSGVKDFYLVANAPASLASSVTTATELLEAVSKFSRNASDRLVMAGSALRQDIQGDTPLNVQLARIASRFEIRTVTKAFSSPALQGLPFTIESVFLMNVPMQALYFTSSEHAADPAATSGWGLWRRNDGSATGANPPGESVTATTSYTPSSPVSVTSSTQALKGHYLYAYPNPSPEAPDVKTRDYVTKLVLRTRLGNDVLYYTIGIPQTGRNCVYTVESLTLKRRGTTFPGDYVSTDDISFNITVKDWDTGVIQSSFADGNGSDYSI